MSYSNSEARLPSMNISHYKIPLPSANLYCISKENQKICFSVYLPKGAKIENVFRSNETNRKKCKAFLSVLENPENEKEKVDFICDMNPTYNGIHCPDNMKHIGGISRSINNFMYEATYYRILK
jgi:hypothetical protein